MKKNFPLAVLLTLSLTGCSSIVSKTDYPVSINSSPEGASFAVTNRAGNAVHSGSTPATITLSSSAGYFKGESYTITLSKEGFSTKEYTINSSLDGWYFGNILLGGLIGMLIVDPATGAMYNLPERVDVTLDAQSAASKVSTLTIASIDSLSPAQKSSLIRID